MGAKERILTIVKKIPRGKVASYATVAQISASNPRAVGAVMCANHDPTVPCHRVICSNDSLGGFNRGLKEKKRLLKFEGVVIENGRVTDKFFRAIA